MSGKRCVAYFRYEETKKKRKLDDGPAEAAAIHEEEDANANANELSDKLGRLSTSLHNYTPSRSNASGSVNDDDDDSENKQKLGNSSSSTVILLEESAESRSSTSIESNEYLVYKKRLTRDDVFYHRLVIPLESGIQFLPEPAMFQGRYELTEMIVIDHENHTWEFLASFYDLNNSYLFWKNWDKYVSKYGLQPDDVIFLYEDPDDDSRSHLLIEYQKATINNDIKLDNSK